MAIASGQVTLADVNDGVALYTWVRYADTATGEGMSDSPTGKKYIGLAYNKTTITPSSNPSDYAWALIQGEQGVAGERGADGITYYTWIKYADSPTTGMSDSPTGKAYVGIATNKTTPTESTNYGDYQWSLIKGADGQTLYTWVKYADTPTSGMSDSPTNKTYIGLAYNKTTPTESTNYSDYSWSLIKGADGVRGADGADGQTYYTWIKYADDANGNGMSDSPTDKRYLGLAHNKTTATESSNPADYMWSPLYDNVKVGGRNLLRDSQTSVTNSTYAMKDYTLAEPIANGETVTISLKGTLGADRTSFGIYNSGGTVSLATLTPAKQDSNGVFKQTFTWNIGSSSNTFLRVYQMTSSGTSSSTIQWIQLERGNVASDYTVANEDVKSSIDSATSTATTAKNRTDDWIMTGKTTIDGGKIEADTITSAQIQAGSITANELSVDDLSAVSANLGNVTAGQINGVSFTSPSVVKQDNIGRTWTTGVAIANYYNAFMTSAQIDPSTNGGYIAYQDVRIDYDGIMMWCRDDSQGMNTIVSYTGSGIFFDGSTSHYDPDGGQHNLRSAQNMYVHGERGLYLSAGTNKNVQITNTVDVPEIVLRNKFSTSSSMTIGFHNPTGFPDGVARIRIGGSGQGAINGFRILGVADRLLLGIDNNGIIENEPLKTVSLSNNWVQYSGFQQVGYYKDAFGVVHIQGLIRNGITTQGTQLFRLDSNYRPPSTILFICQAATSQYARVDVNSDGWVVLNSSGVGSYLSLSGISFRV